MNGFNVLWRMCAVGVSYPLFLWQFNIADFLCPDGVDMKDFVVFAGQWEREELVWDVWSSGGDGTVNFLDWAVLADGWQGDMGQLSDFADEWLKAGAYCADIAPSPDGDGRVDMLDLIAFVENWLEGVE